MSDRVDVCERDEIDEEEDVIRSDHDGKTFAIYRSPDDAFRATDDRKNGGEKESVVVSVIASFFRSPACTTHWTIVVATGTAKSAKSPLPIIGHAG